ncbi:MAG: pyruvate dehydrogenase [Bdellovibrionales bacterium]
MSKKLNFKVLDRVLRRAHYLANQMIHVANNRADVEKGDPKVGGHSSASASALHILGALHLVVKTGFDHIAVKPHASPADHSFNYMMDLLLKSDLSRLSPEEAEKAMHHLRAFPPAGEYGFQSYHSIYDPDHHNFFPSGTVGIPPVNAGYLALAYNFARKHGYEAPEAHFWSLIGDSEFREGSLHEAIPDFAERELGNLTWIIDYNRQSLDGHRITNKGVMSGTDATRIERTMEANGWEVIQVRHGQKRKAIFMLPDGEKFKRLLETDLADYELQVLLQLKTGKEIRDELLAQHKDLANFLKNVNDQDLYEALRDMGGHDLPSLIEAMEQSKRDKRRPTMIIAHTIKGWQLKMAATPGNHSSLPEQAEIDQLREAQGLKADQLFARFDAKSEEGYFLKERGEQLYAEIREQHAIKSRNIARFKKEMADLGEMPETLDINLKLASYPHTQWMLGQLTAKLTRIANTPLNEKKLKEKQKPLSEREKTFKLAAEMLVSMAPDVGTSTNLNPAMDGKIYGAPVVEEDLESEYGVKDKSLPDLIPGEEESDRFLRFEIAEANVMSCMGSFGRMRDVLGIPLLPLMTVYDFFVKRALDQYFYNLYWKSSFILVGTPSGVTLSPEGAQHGWKSDFQIPNQITWEPFYCQELDWILVDAVRRHMTFDNEGRSGVNIRGVTRGVEQKDFLNLLKTQRRFKNALADGQLLSPKGLEVAGATDESQVETWADTDILKSVRDDVLSGAYYLIDYRGYAGYEPGDNVVNIFAMGSLGTEAIKASRELLEKGIYANVIMVTSPDLLAGNLAHENDYHHLRQTLGVNATLYLQPHMNGTTHVGEMLTMSGRRVPMVSVHDGEIGLLDNLGSIVGVRQEVLAVRKHSRCGRPSDVYAYHHINAASVVEACGKVLSETALERVEISPRLLNDSQTHTSPATDWRQLWSSGQGEKH